MEQAKRRSATVERCIDLSVFNLHNISLDNIDMSHDSASLSKADLPFSMSGDGVEDVEIPSVFMRKADAQYLQDLVKESGEVVVQLLSSDEVKADNVEKEDKSDGEGAEKVAQEEEMEENDLDLDAANVEVLSRKVQSLLEGLDPNVLSDELKDSVAKELSKLKELNEEVITESTISNEEGTSERDSTGIDGHSGGGCHSDTCTVASQSDGGPGPG